MSEPRENGMDNTRSYVPISKGTMISHYKIIEKIGAGGMGEVYLAEDTGLHRKVALKFLPPHLCQDEDCRARFKREAQATAKLNHPNIVTIHEVSEYQGRPYFAMEHVEGRALRDIIKKNEFSISEVVDLAIGICEGLNKAHQAGIVHRDIKPSNIVIDTDGRPKLLDFGLAAIRGSEKLTISGSTLGTIGYMSPEQVQGRGVDQRSDLFSLGVVLYEMITARTPFEHDNEAATLKSIGQDTPEPLRRYKSDVPDELQRIVSKLLEKDPSVRYQNAAGVISDLKPLVTPIKSSIIMSLTKQRNRWPLAVSGLVIITVLSVTVIKYWPGRETAHPVTTTQERIMMAVLPFENLGSSEDEYFADGITDEIRSRITVLGGLGVIARTSILQYKGTIKRISEIGEELGVDYILEGTIRWDKSGEVDKIRITPQLIRVSDETPLWADNIQRELSQIFKVQEEIAAQIAGALNIALLSGEQEELVYRPTENLDAYGYYLRARNYLDRNDHLMAIELLDKATELDSTFALAFALKSQLHSTYAFFNELGASEHTRPARLAYQRAFEIQPDLAEAHLARGTYLNLIERDYSGALEEFELAQQGQVDEAKVLDEISVVKLRQGKWHEAIALNRQVIKLDPRSFRAGLTTIQANWFIHQYDEALEALERTISIAPDQVLPYLWKAQIQVSMGADVEQIQISLSEWLSRATSEGWIFGASGLMLFKLSLLWNQSIDVDAEIAVVMSRVRDYPNPHQYFYAGLLYQLKGDEISSYLYLDSVRILIENRVAEARSDSTGRYEDRPVEHNVYELLALSYSQTNRHGKAIEQAQLAMETMPVEACHW